MVVRVGCCAHLISFRLLLCDVPATVDDDRRTNPTHVPRNNEHFPLYVLLSLVHLVTFAAGPLSRFSRPAARKTVRMCALDSPCGMGGFNTVVFLV